MEGNGRRRVVVTGTGVVTPIGLTSRVLGLDEARPVRRQPARGLRLDDLKILIAGADQGFRSQRRLKHFQRDKLILYADRYSWFAAAAADEAVSSRASRRPSPTPIASACIVGSGAGGLSTIEKCLPRSLHPQEARHPPADAAAHHRLLGQRPRRHRVRHQGPDVRHLQACSTATHAIGIARDYIRNGVVDVAIAGASEASSTTAPCGPGRPCTCCRREGCFPFAKKRNGTVLGEGAGILVLE